VYGWPRIANEGELTIGANVSVLATPAAVEFIVAPGAQVAVGERVLIESGVSIRARGKIRVGSGVRIGRGCIVDDDGGGEITLGDGAWLEDGAVIHGGTTVPVGAVVPGPAGVRDATVLASANDAPTEMLDLAENRVDDVDRRLRSVLSRIVAATSGVEPTAELTQVKGWDSLAALRALVALEKEFSVVLPINLFAERPSVGSLRPVIAASVARHAGIG
jgi:acyl carrier protein